MKIAYKLRADSLVGRVVARCTGTPIHVELVFSDGQSFRCEIGAPCRFVPAPTLADVNSGAWRIDDLGALALDEAKARAYCGALAGEPYDVLRSAAGWWGWELDVVDRENCCEATCSALVVAGAPPSLRGRPSTTPKRTKAAVDELLVHAIVLGALHASRLYATPWAGGLA